MLTIRVVATHISLHFRRKRHCIVRDQAAFSRPMKRLSPVTVLFRWLHPHPDSVTMLQRPRAVPIPSAICRAHHTLFLGRVCDWRACEKRRLSAVGLESACTLGEMDASRDSGSRNCWEVAIMITRYNATVKFLALWFVPPASLTKTETFRE